MFLSQVNIYMKTSNSYCFSFTFFRFYLIVQKGISFVNLSKRVIIFRNTHLSKFIIFCNIMKLLKPINNALKCQSFRKLHVQRLLFIFKVHINTISISAEVSVRCTSWNFVMLVFNQKIESHNISDMHCNIIKTGFLRHKENYFKGYSQS